MGVFDKLKAIVQPKDAKKKKEEEEARRHKTHVEQQRAQQPQPQHHSGSSRQQQNQQQQGGSSSTKHRSPSAGPASNSNGDNNNVTIPEGLLGAQALLSATAALAAGPNKQHASFASSVREELTRGGEINRQDFEPLAILGKGTFASVLLVRATGRLADAYRLATAAAAANGNNGNGSNKNNRATFGNFGFNNTSDSRTFWPPSYDGEDPIFAMKIVPKKKLIDLKRVNDVFIERNVLAKSGEANPFVIKLRHTFQSEHKLFFVMDYMAGGDMRALINEHKRRREPMSYNTVKLYAAEIALALVNLHKNGILYRDLKPENILLDGDGHCYLADFGLSKDFGIWGTSNGLEGGQNTFNNANAASSHLSVPGQHNPGHSGGGLPGLHPSNMRASSFVGSPMYVAPEVLLRKETYSTPVDFWGFGVILYTMLYGAEPFRGLNVKAIFDQILTQNVAFPPAKFPTPPEIIDLIAKLLIKDPAKRLNGSNLFSHPFFQSMDINAIKRKEIKPEGFILKPPPCAIAKGLPDDVNHNNNMNTNTNSNSNGKVLPAIPPNALLDANQPSASSTETGYNDMYTPEHLQSGFRASQQKLFQDFGWCAIDDLLAQQEAAEAAERERQEQLWLAQQQQQEGGGGGGAGGHHCHPPHHHDDAMSTSNYSHYSHSFGGDRDDGGSSVCSEGYYDDLDGGHLAGTSSAPPSPQHDPLTATDPDHPSYANNSYQAPPPPPPQQEQQAFNNNNNYSNSANVPAQNQRQPNQNQQPQQYLLGGGVQQQQHQYHAYRHNQYVDPLSLSTSNHPHPQQQQQQQGGGGEGGVATAPNTSANGSATAQHIAIAATMLNSSNSAMIASLSSPHSPSSMSNMTAAYTSTATRLMSPISKSSVDNGGVVGLPMMPTPIMISGNNHQNGGINGGIGGVGNVVPVAILRGGPVVQAAQFHPQQHTSGSNLTSNSGGADSSSTTTMSRNGGEANTAVPINPSVASASTNPPHSNNSHSSHEQCLAGTTTTASNADENSPPSHPHRLGSDADGGNGGADGGESSSLDAAPPFGVSAGTAAGEESVQRMIGSD